VALWHGVGVEPLQMPPSVSSNAAWDRPLLSRGSYATFLYGTSRTVLLRVAYGLARASDPNLYWVAIRDPDERVEPPGPIELGWVPDDHLFVVSRTEAKPQDAISNLALWTIVRSDEPQSAVISLTEFLRLPPLVQEAVSRYGQESPRPIFVVANSDRAREYYPRNAEGVRALLDALLNGGVMPIFVAVGPPGAGRSAFEVSMEVEASDLAHWREGSLRCERAVPGLPLQPGERIRLDSIPAVAAALEGRKDAGTSPS
jgi:hypothetical protein